MCFILPKELQPGETNETVTPQQPVNVITEVDFNRPQRLPFIVNSDTLEAYLIGDNITGTMAEDAGTYVCVVANEVRETVMINILGKRFPVPA